MKCKRENCDNKITKKNRIYYKLDIKQYLNETVNDDFRKVWRQKFRDYVKHYFKRTGNTLVIVSIPFKICNNHNEVNYVRSQEYGYVPDERYKEYVLVGRR